MEDEGGKTGDRDDLSAGETEIQPRRVSNG